MRAIGIGIVGLACLLARGGDALAARGLPRERAATGPAAEVQMIGDGRGRAAFRPAALTVTPGTTVRFVNVWGGPHNVVFWPDSMPPGAAELLDAAMPRRMARLAGPLLTLPNETYDITMPPTVPPGRYRGYCLPHLALGMTIAITVR